MQLGVGGRCGDYWGRNKCDGNDDGKRDVLDPWDNICASAKGLRREKGAPATGGSMAAYRGAAGRYYGACTGNGVAYCDEVMTRAARYGLRDGEPTVSLAGVGDGSGSGTADVDGGSPQCDAPDGARDATLTEGPARSFTLLAAANRAGVALTPTITQVVRRIAGRLPRRLTVCTGTNHNERTTSGNVSDHWAGNAVDLCSSANGFPASGGGYGDTIAAAALMATGKSRGEAVALARRGGNIVTNYAGLRFQIIWKSHVGGNHYDHIHVGVRTVVSARA
jgi:hypothetical protein